MPKAGQVLWELMECKIGAKFSIAEPILNINLGQESGPSRADSREISFCGLYQPSVLGDPAWEDGAVPDLFPGRTNPGQMQSRSIHLA